MTPNDDIGPTVSRLETESKNLMLVGHLPHLSRLVARLLELEVDRTVVQFPMAGVVRIDRAESGGWVVQWALVPELLPPDSNR